MIAPRWRKVEADAFANPIRTLLVALSIAVGVFAVGAIASAYLLIAQDLPADYAAARPHGGTISAEAFDDDLVSAAAHVPGVARAEGRSLLRARIEVRPGAWLPVQITGRPRPADTRIDLLRPAAPGAELPDLRDREVLVERSSLGLLAAPAGSVVHVMLPDRRIRELRVAGAAYDSSGFPSNFSGQVSLYANLNTMEWLTGSRAYRSLLFTASDRPTDEAHVRVVAEAIADKIRKSGRQVFLTSVVRPGEHPANSIIQTFLAVLGLLGVLALGLSGFLVVNTMNALLAQHTRQIGVMKAVGARTYQIAGMYAVLVLGFGLLALLLAAPAAALAGYALARWLAAFINFNLAGLRVTPAPLVLECGVALLLPLLASTWPLWSGLRVTVREAISDYGMGRGQFGTSRLDRLLEAIRFLSRPLLLSLRNTFRRKGRLALTLATLALAGAIFISVLNLQVSFDIVIRQVLGYFLSDVNVTLDRPYGIPLVEAQLAAIPGVQRVESWMQVAAQALAPGGATGDEIILWAPPAKSQLVQPVITAGRWLLPDDENAIVVDNHLRKLRPDLRVGDDLVLKIDGRKSTWRIVGFYELAGNTPFPFVYANREYLGRLLDRAGQGEAYRVVTSPEDPASQSRVAQAIQDRLLRYHVEVGDVQTGAALRAMQASQTNIIIYFLLLMALLMALVGGLGLLGTMSMNVMERTREIGVMRAIGAADRSVMSLVLAEGLLTGLLSWLLAALLALPITRLMDNLVGRAFLQVPVDFAVAPLGFALWLLIMLGLAALASFIPAWRAERMSVREALAYE